MVVNALTAPGHVKKIMPKTMRVLDALLMTILGILWCFPSRTTTVEEVFKRLHHLDPSITARTKSHPIFGDVAQRIKTFETQLYLVSKVEQDSDGQRTVHYAYGPRTLLEITLPQILHFLHKVCALLMS